MSKHMNTDQTRFWLPNLDALRALAYISVFVSHAVLFLDPGFYSAFLVQGDLGVNFFFVLSGFLITFLIYRERHASGKLSIKSFYIRRILRIWPVYFITLIIAIIATLLFVPGELYLGFFTLFLGNFAMAYYSSVSLAIAILWSVSVEEQFYLLWPWFTEVRTKLLVWIMCVGIALSFVYRFINISEYKIVAYSSLSVMSDLLVGCVLAVSVSKSARFKEIISNLPKFASAMIWVATCLFLYLRISVDSDLGRALGPLIFSLLSALIISDQVFGKNSIFKVDKIAFCRINDMLAWIGKRSYGLYCYHIISIILVQRFAADFPFLFKFALAFTTACAISALSYRFIEKPLLMMRYSKKC